MRARTIQQQPQEVDWNKRSPTKATLALVTSLLKDFDIYKRPQGVSSLHDCCGVEFLTLLEGAMDVAISVADDGDDPLRALLVAPFEPPETFDVRLKTEALAMAIGKRRRPHTFPPASPKPPKSILSSPRNILYVHPRDENEEYHYSDETNE